MRISEDQWSVECTECGPLAVTTEKEAEPTGMLHLMKAHGAKFDQIDRTEKNQPKEQS